MSLVSCRFWMHLDITNLENNGNNHFAPTTGAWSQQRWRVVCLNLNMVNKVAKSEADILCDAVRIAGGMKRVPVWIGNVLPFAAKGSLSRCSTNPLNQCFRCSTQCVFHTLSLGLITVMICNVVFSGLLQSQNYACYRLFRIMTI